MKTLFKTFAYAAIAALALSSCAKEKLQPADELTGKLVTVHFGTENTDPSTKSTLTPDAGETAFQAAWEKGDEILISYSYNYGNPSTTTGRWKDNSFEANLTGGKGVWIYYAAYPVPAENNSVAFGSNRTQKGNAYNSKYDIMIGSAVAEGADAGKDPQGNDIIFEMDRQTAIAYFHFTSELNESLVSATLKVSDGAIANSAASISDFRFVAPSENDETEIKLTFEDGTAPSANDFQLWFNVLPTSYSLMTLTVETDTKTFTISKNSKGKYEAGKLYKVKKGGISWTEKGESSETVYAYKKIYDQSELTDGSYLIVSEYYKFAVAGSKAATNMIKGGAGTSVDITNDIVNYSSDLALDAFEIKSTSGGYSIKGSTCGYIGYSLDAKNGLQGSSTTVYNNSISIVGGVATITTMNSSNTTYTLCCNPNNNNPLVKYYKTVNETYVPISLYKYQEVDPTQVPKLESPANLHCSTKTKTSLTFSWDAVANASGYKVSTDGGSTYGDTQTGTSYTWTGLEANTSHTLYVKAIGDGTNYTDSDAATATGTTTSGGSTGGATPTEKTVFLETFGSTASTPAFNTYTGYSATAEMFTTSGNVNTHYSGSGKIGKYNYSDTKLLSSGYTGASGESGCFHSGSANIEATILQISNINIKDCVNISVSFGALGGGSSHKVSVYYTIDGGAETALITDGAITNAEWTLLNANISGTGTSLTLIFKHKPTKSWLIRMDDIKVVGTK